MGPWANLISGGLRHHLVVASHTHRRRLVTRYGVRARAHQTIQARRVVGAIVGCGWQSGRARSYSQPDARSMTAGLYITSDPVFRVISTEYCLRI